MNKISFKGFMAILVVIAGVFVAFVGCSKKTDNTETTGSIIDNNEKYWDSGFWAVTWDEWGRKKKNCDGWGLCNIKIEYVLYDTLFDKSIVSHYSPIYSQDKGTCYFDILYDSQYDCLVEDANKFFYIDDDIYDLNNGYIFRIPQGEYPLIPCNSSKNKYHIPIEITKIE